VDLAQAQYRSKSKESPDERSAGSGCVVVGGKAGPRWLGEMEEPGRIWMGDGEEEEEVVDEVEQGIAVIALAFISPPQHNESWAVAEGPTLLIGTPARVLLLDSLSLESLASLDFQLDPPNEPPPAPSVSLVGAYAMSPPVQTVSGLRADGAEMR